MKHGARLPGRLMRGALMLAVLAFLAPALSGCSTLAALFSPRPRVVVVPARADLGTVEEGVDLHTTFQISNQGNKELKLFQAHSSCGCTVPELKQNVLAPGQSTQLEVLVDTSMKQGAVTKEIDLSSDDPDSPLVRLEIAMMVKDRHVGLSDSGRAKIFVDPNCKSCHVDRGVGLAGAELYEADCAMCHGRDAGGAVGPALNIGDYADKAYAEHIRSVIAHGSLTHASMPAFLAGEGGPLLDEQIDSIVTYLERLSKEKRQPPKNSGS